MKDERFKTAPAAHQKNSEPAEKASSNTHFGAYIDNLVETLVINARTPENKVNKYRGFNFLCCIGEIYTRSRPFNLHNQDDGRQT